MGVCSDRYFYTNNFLILITEDEVKELKNRVNSRVEEVKVDELQPADDVVVIYNRVPKTGSTSFVGVAYDLCKKNKYHALHINVTNNMHTLTLPNQVNPFFKLAKLLLTIFQFLILQTFCFQMLFVNNITYWNEIKPAFYHGHMAFLNFEK